MKLNLCCRRSEGQTGKSTEHKKENKRYGTQKRRFKADRASAHSGCPAEHFYCTGGCNNACKKGNKYYKGNKYCNRGNLNEFFPESCWWCQKTYCSLEFCNLY